MLALSNETAIVEKLHLFNELCQKPKLCESTPKQANCNLILDLCSKMTKSATYIDNHDLSCEDGVAYRDLETYDTIKRVVEGYLLASEYMSKHVKYEANLS